MTVLAEVLRRRKGRVIFDLEGGKAIESKESASRSCSEFRDVSFLKETCIEKNEITCSGKSQF